MTHSPQKNSLPIYALFTANAISLVGNVLSAIAIPWFVLQTTGSATRTGITGFFTVLPVVLAGFDVPAPIGRLVVLEDDPDIAVSVVRIAPEG